MRIICHKTNNPKFPAYNQVPQHGLAVVGELEALVIKGSVPEVDFTNISFPLTNLSMF